MAETISSTPLSDVMVAGRQVWLRKNIHDEQRIDESGTSETVHVADEVTFVVPKHVSEGYVREHMDELWQAHSQDGTATRDIAFAAQQAGSDNAYAIADLAQYVSDGVEGSDSAQGALADLASTVSDLAAQVAALKAKEA